MPLGVIEELVQEGRGEHHGEVGSFGEGDAARVLGDALDVEPVVRGVGFGAAGARDVNEAVEEMGIGFGHRLFRSRTAHPRHGRTLRSSACVSPTKPPTNSIARGAPSARSACTASASASSPVTATLFWRPWSRLSDRANIVVQAKDFPAFSQDFR